MKKIILGFAVVAFSISSVNAQGKKLTTTTNSNAQVSVVDKTDQLKFNEETHDFGTVIQGTPTTFEFKVTNKGKAPLVIESAKSTCGCTVPTFSKEPIARKKTGVIKVTYDSGRLGPINKPITVVTNYGTKVLHIKGKVVSAPETSVPENSSMIRTK